MTSTASPDPASLPLSPAADAVPAGAGEVSAIEPSTDSTARRKQVRRRQRGDVRRPHRIGPVYSDDELLVVKTAARLANVTPAAYVQKCSVDMGMARVRPAPTALVDALGELLQARLEVQRFSTLVNQAMMKWHATDEFPPELMGAVERVASVLPRLEEAAAATRIAQGGGRRRAVRSFKQAPDPDPGAGHESEDGSRS